MDTWWCAIDREPLGPLTIEQLRPLLNQRRIDRQTLVWREGMASWEELQNVAELAAALLAPPPLPTGRPSGSLDRPPHATIDTIRLEPPQTTSLDFLGVDPRRTPMRRFCARLIDLNIAAFVLGIVLFLPLSILSPEFASWLESSPNANALTFWLLPLTPLVDTAIRQIAGRTAGKAIFDIRIDDKLGRRLTWTAMLARNYRVYWFGLAACIPIVGFIAMGYQLRLLKTFGIAAYDIGRHSVTVMPVSRMRASLGVVTFLLLTASNLYFMISDIASRH